MKRLLLLFVALLSMTFGHIALAQTKTKISDGVYLVRYGNTAVIEDEKNQRSISIEVTQEVKDRQTGEKVYNVVCGKWTKRVAKFALKTAVTEGIRAAAVSHGASLIISSAATAAEWIYDDVCEYYGEKYK